MSPRAKKLASDEQFKTVKLFRSSLKLIREIRSDDPLGQIKDLQFKSIISLIAGIN